MTRTFIQYEFWDNRNYPESTSINTVIVFLGFRIFLQYECFKWIKSFQMGPKFSTVLSNFGVPFFKS